MYREGHAALAPEWLLLGCLLPQKGQLHAVGSQEKQLFSILMENIFEPANETDG